MAHILLIEDERNLAFLLENSLIDQGHSVVWTESASDGFKIFLEQKFDLVVTDLVVLQNGGLSTRSGTMLISRIRSAQASDDAQDDQKVTPILAISGTINKIGQEHMLAMARHVGADRVLAKPFSVVEFDQAVEALLSTPS